MRRETACGGSCAACGGCEGGAVVAVAENTVGAKVGDIALAETRTRDVMGAALVVYMLPVLLAVLGVFVARAFELGEGFSIFFAFLGIAAGIFAAVLYSKNRKGGSRITVIRVVTGETSADV